MTDGRLDTYLVRDSDGTEQPVCRECIMEDDDDARFEGDDWTEWELKQEDEYGFDRTFNQPAEQEDDLEDGYYGTLYRKDPQRRSCVWSQNKDTCMSALKNSSNTTETETLNRLREWIVGLQVGLKNDLAFGKTLPAGDLWSAHLQDRSLLRSFDIANRKLCELLGIQPTFIFNSPSTEATHNEKSVGIGN